MNKPTAKKKKNKRHEDVEPIVLWNIERVHMGEDDSPNPWRDKNAYIEFLCFAIETYFEDSIYQIAADESYLYIDNDNIWAIQVARYEAQSKLSYYKFIGFKEVGQMEYDAYSAEDRFVANEELVKKFVEENFDNAYFD